MSSSIIYEEDEEVRQIPDSGINHVFTSNYMLNFAQNLALLTRSDYKE